MRTMLTQVRSLIEGAAGTARVFHAWPADWSRFPAWHTAKKKTAPMRARTALRR